MRIYLREIRKEKGLSINMLAKLSGVSKGAISKIENREMMPGIDIVTKICMAMKIELNDLVDIHN